MGRWGDGRIAAFPHSDKPKSVSLSIITPGDIPMNRNLDSLGETQVTCWGESACPLFLLPIHCSDSVSLWQLVKTHDLSPKHNYIIVNHPHGIVSYGVFINFATEATDVARIFPGITPSVATLEWIFWIPIVREYVMSLGEYKKSFHPLSDLSQGSSPTKLWESV